ncbi:hypothetical protein TNIN_350191 [Trichonephila inaurata madagascariensis]|uniref:Uncharacterized protein n=1 Tax=Trichonephila inaurata madagascariensis TaxID=2747483 RepID=A0A8X7C4C8_9ARAC|nr:hypothetical protein TNIN_350191 [Trichonephila inaurata madagascariensis]
MPQKPQSTETTWDKPKTTSGRESQGAPQKPTKTEKPQSMPRQWQKNITPSSKDNTFDPNSSRKWHLYDSWGTIAALRKNRFHAFNKTLSGIQLESNGVKNI